MKTQSINKNKPQRLFFIFLLFFVFSDIAINEFFRNVTLDTYKALSFLIILRNILIFSIFLSTLIFIKNQIKKKDRKLRLLRLVFVIISFILMFFTTKGPIQTLFLKPINYSGSCELIYSSSKKIRINERNYFDKKGYFYQLIMDGQRVFNCYSNKPCKCNSNIKAVLIPGMNLVVDLEKTGCQ